MNLRDKLEIIRIGRRWIIAAPSEESAIRGACYSVPMRPNGSTYYGSKSGSDLSVMEGSKIFAYASEAPAIRALAKLKAV